MRLDTALRRGADVVVVVVGGWSGWSPCCLMCSLRSCISRLVVLDESVVMPVMPGWMVERGGAAGCAGCAGVLVLVLQVSVVKLVMQVMPGVDGERGCAGVLAG
jgi:hypothetical protein